MLFLEKFYRAVVKAVLLFEAETWVFLDAMLKTLEGVHVGFLKQVKGKKDRRKNDRYWWREASDSVIQEAGAQPLHTYIKRRQAEVAKLMALRPILRYA